VSGSATVRHAIGCLDKRKSGIGCELRKRNFLAGQTFADVQAMNERVKHWITKTAGQRIHGTTKEAPLARFHRGELDTLQPLPTTPFDLVATYYAKVHRDCHAHVNSRHYSVPYRFIGRKVELYIGQK